jgi:hypothetical protein
MARITPEQELRILAQIRAGSYPHIAAEAAGVPRRVFAGWLKRGRQQARGWQRRFWLKVREARAHAHALAAVEVRKKDVKFWLRYGPGKPGRTRKGRDQPDWRPEFFQLLSEIATELMPMPEARQVILSILDRQPLSPS